ncbi:MAG: cupin domain-containing protein [Acidobacteria bacterium]|nr:cupin domain-containing protein [Acidobacteriota bacterium]
MIRQSLSVCMLFLLFVAASLPAQERRVDPTFLRRFVPALEARASDLTSATSRYKPIFGAGDPDARVVRGIARYGELTVDPGGASPEVSYAAEEQVYVILEGTGLLRYGEEDIPVRKHDYMYLAPGIRHGIRNPSSQPLRLIVMGFKIPAGVVITLPPNLPLANMDEVRLQTVGGHPPTTLYRLLMGDTRSTRDRLAVAHVVTSLFTMEFDPGGTNFPHHHEQEEEIYLVLSGYGEMVAGSGLDGIEGKFPARAGDACFFRLNCTVGFYAGNKAGEEKARILAVRSLFPSARRQ